MPKEEAVTQRNGETKPEPSQGQGSIQAQDSLQKAAEGQAGSRGCQGGQQAETTVGEEARR